SRVRLTSKQRSCYRPPVSAPAIALQGVTPEELSSLLPAVTVEDARRIVSTVHRDGDVSLPSSVVRRVAREAVVAGGRVPVLEVVNRAASELDPFVKLALRT